METCLSYFKEALHLEARDPGEYSPLALAYIGDAVYDLIIRSLVMSRGNMQVNKMHKKTASLVKAQAQAEMYKLLEAELTEEEKSIYRRGRNAKSGTMAKNAAMKDYRMATGFEALMGYLYLTERFERMAELVGRGLARMGEISPAEGMSGCEKSEAGAEPGCGKSEPEAEPCYENAESDAELCYENAESDAELCCESAESEAEPC